MTSSTDQAYVYIRQKIVNGGFPGGARLKEDEIARTLGISRTPVRDALRRLNGEGMVTFMLNQGARVTSWSTDDMEEITALRAVLESFAAELAAGKVDGGGLAQLNRIQAKMAACVERSGRPDIDGVARHNNEFHKAIVELAGNSRLTIALRQIVELPLIARKFATFDLERLKRSLAHHQEIIAAFEARDPQWAASAMRTHILASRAYDARLAGRTNGGGDGSGR